MDCVREKELCSFYAGDTVEYGFEFKDGDGGAVDVSGATLSFTLKINKDLADSDKTGLQVKTVIGDEGLEGKTSMSVGASLTRRLLVRRWYYFDFQLAVGGKAFTMGAGKVMVKQKVKSA